MDKIHSKSDSADTLVVLVSPAGVVENFDVLPLVESTSEEADKRLCQCINRFCQIADRGDYVPDNWIQVYQYNPDTHLENKFWQFTTDRDSIASYVTAKEVQAYFQIPLRTILRKKYGIALTDPNHPQLNQRVGTDIPDVCREFKISLKR